MSASPCKQSERSSACSRGSHPPTGARSIPAASAQGVKRNGPVPGFSETPGHCHREAARGAKRSHKVSPNKAWEAGKRSSHLDQACAHMLNKAQLAVAQPEPQVPIHAAVQKQTA